MKKEEADDKWDEDSEDGEASRSSLDGTKERE